MEALDNPSYFRLSSKEAADIVQGAPRARDIAPDEQVWKRRGSDHEAVLLGSSSGNSAGMVKVFRMQKKAVRLMLGLNSRTSCRVYFRELGFMTVRGDLCVSVSTIYKG
ncbi:hypothetical protein O3M35_009009 [Rhynocoris fuscipes]|uniref:Uncharacterized protein n=1 Tax=Rhynocoris fuscipes TaxID=488301 RepID=A0AAW1D1H4_9HEMI